MTSPLAQRNITNGNASNTAQRNITNGSASNTTQHMGTNGKSHTTRRAPTGPIPAPISIPGPHGYAPQVSPAPLVGASGIPVTPDPNLHPFGPNPFTWAGGYWPGWSIAHDPVSGQSFWTCTPPAGAPEPSTPAPPQGRHDPNDYGEVPPTPTRPGPRRRRGGDPRNGNRA
jgi:hypothetical protein